MKDTFYFSHDYNAQQDEKIQKLLATKGWEGYGLYWAIIESLYQNDGYLELDCERIAFLLRTHSELIKAILFDYNLFEILEKKFTSRSVLRRLKARKSKSEKARKSAEAKWKKHYANAERTQSERNAIKESKVKESKIILSKDNMKQSEFGNSEINQMLELLKKTFGLPDFKEPRQKQRWHGKNLVTLVEKQGKEKFRAALTRLAEDEFKRRNCNSLRYVYGELKSSPINEGLISPNGRVFTVPE